MADPDAEDFKERMVTDSEMSALIRKSSSKAVARFGFGPAGAWLEDSPDNQWAMDALREMRKQEQERNDE